MLPIPRHLLKVFQADTDKCDEYNLEGKICCDCGCDSFQIKIFADLKCGAEPHVCKYQDDYALVIKAVCRDCKKEWLLFDMSQHGYNGYVCHDGLPVPDTELKIFACPECGEDLFEIAVGIEVEDQAQFIEEVVEYEPEHFSKEDYVDAFDWINIDIKCPHCKKQIKGWINFETS